MKCQRNGNNSTGSLDHRNDEDRSLTFPALVVRGEQVSCYISVESWDTNVRLIANDCQFMSTDSGTTGPTFTFIKNKSGDITLLSSINTKYLYL